jgi:tetratricopeptide (TPR) repeat protein
MKKDEIAKHSNLIAFLTAAVFVSHPLQTEAVTYIVQRATSLSALFYLASLCLYIKSRVLEIEGTDSGQNHNLYYFASLITASVGMLTKEMLITLPLAVVLYEFIFLKTQHRLNWKKILSFFIISLIVPLIFLFTKSENSKELMQVFKYTPHIPRLSYLLTQFRVTVTYLRLLFIPWNQNLDYDYPVYNTLFQLPVFASLLFLILILVAAIRISSKYRLLAFGIFWFFLTLLPESSILPLADVIFEHRLYLPMLGYSISLVSIMYYLFKNRSIKAMVVILLLTVHWYAISAYNRNFDWRNEFTLWNDAVKKSPKKARPYGNRGVANIYLGNLDQAISDFNTEINLNPNYAEVEARSYGNRGVANIYLGNLDQAISDFNTVIYINPNYYKAYVHRGNAYVTKGNFIQAFSDFDKALQINPQYAEAYYNRAVAYFLQKEYDKSWQDIHKAEGLGKIVNLDFLNALKKASKREE